MNLRKNLGKFFGRYRIVSFVSLALLISVIMVSISLWIYTANGAIKLDLSRPGYEQVRQDIVQEDEVEKPFSFSGELTAEVLKDFQERLDKQQKNLDNLGDFGGEILNDKNLGL